MNKNLVKVQLSSKRIIFIDPSKVSFIYLDQSDDKEWNNYCTLCVEGESFGILCESKEERDTLLNILVENIGGWDYDN